jgi:GAF domain-containing protein
VELPPHPTQADVGQAFGHTRQLWQDQAPLNLLTLPAMTDPNRLAAMQILSWLVSCAYWGNPALMALIIFKQVEFSIQDGNCPVSIYSHADYGLILCGVIGDIPSGYDFGQLALQLLDELQVPPFKSRAWYVFYTYIQHWKAPLQASISRLQEAFQSGLETGDLETAGLNAAAYCSHAYHAGQELTGLVNEIDAYRQTIRQLKQTTPLHYLEIYQQTVLNLLEETETPDQLTGTVFNQVTSLPLLQAGNHRTALFYFYFNQAVLSFLFGEYQQAAETSILAEQHLDGGIGTFMVPLYAFYDSLIQLALYSSVPEGKQQAILERVAEQQGKLQGWTTLASFNHKHRWELVEAERHAVLGDRIAAIESYDRAIASAHQNGFMQDEAIANELAAQFYLGWSKEKIAQEYLTNAYYGYVHWGAKAKVQDLERRYPQLLAPILQQQQMALSATETVFATTALVTSQAPGTKSSTSGSTSISATLDLATVLKASQTLSSEMQLDRLLATLLHTVLENAGADKGALLMPRDHQWFVEAVATVDQPAQVQSIALSSSAEIPHGLINTVKRSRQPVVIMDATIHPTLATDAYVVQQQPKSLLCTPILQQGKLVAILYLENHVTGGAFTSDRVELLNFLCTQAAISLENARLYQQAQTYAQQLEQSQLQMVQAEKMASLGNLVAGVAHEINNPIGFLNGSIKNAKDYVQDLLGYIALYQQHHPNPVAPVQDYAEEIDLEYLSEDLPKLLNSMNGATDRIKGISTSLRTFSRADTEHKVSANLHEGIDSTLLILKYRLQSE